MADLISQLHLSPSAEDLYVLDIIHVYIGCLTCTYLTYILIMLPVYIVYITCIYCLYQLYILFMSPVYIVYVTCVYRMSARHESTSGWGAERLYIIVTEDHTIISQSVQVRSGDLFGAMEAYIIPTL